MAEPTLVQAHTRRTTDALTLTSAAEIRYDTITSTDDVRAYKRTSEKLKMITSDVLNASKAKSPKKRKAEHEYEPACKRAKEKENQPIFNISGGYNITIHLSSNPLNLALSH